MSLDTFIWRMALDVSFDMCMWGSKFQTYTKSHKNIAEPRYTNVEQICR